MPKSRQAPSLWLLWGSYTILFFVVFVSPDFIPAPKARTGYEAGVSDLVGLTRFLFVLIPCLLGGSAAFLCYLFYERRWHHRKWFSKKNLDQGLIHVGFIMITVIVFAVRN